MNTMYDIAIIGGGPAGLTAAIYAQRAGKKCIIFEKNIPGGLINDSAKVENIPGFIEIKGSDFAGHLTGQAEFYGANILYEEVTSVSHLEPLNVFLVSADDEYQVKSVIIATGTKHNTLHLPEEEKFIGAGIHFCALCDGAFYKNKNVIIIGGGNSALTEALYLSKICKQITILQNLPYLTGDKILIDKITTTPNISSITNCHELNYLIRNDKLLGVTYCAEDCTQPYQLTQILCDGIFLAIGLSPNSDITNGLLKYNSKGYITEASIDGLYYAGDCSADTEIKQVTTACASGAVAATKACNYIENNIIGN